MEYFVRPWKHQLEAIERAKSVDDFALFFDMGAGKTATTINIVRHKYAEQQRLMRTLILCPVGVVTNWKREWAMHSKVGGRVVILDGSQVKRRKTVQAEKDKRPAPIFITNFEALTMQDLLQDLLEWEPEILIIDESQRLKNHKAKRTKAAILLADLAKHHYILSGTPILNCSRDIWAQYRILDKGETFGNNYYAFEKKYFIDKNSGMPKHVYFPKWVPREGIEEVFQDMIYRKAMRVMKKDCLDLPPLIRTRIDVEMAPEQKRVYESMKRDFIAYLNDQACVAQLAITKALRLLQILAGFVKLDSGEEVALKENPKLEALEEIIDDLPHGSKAIIWATFKENYRQISNMLVKKKIGFTSFHGEVKASERQANIDRFQTDPDCRFIIANQAAGGVGINLTAASYSIYYSRNFSLEQDLQSEARNYRGGSEIHEKITRIDIVCPNTIDEIVLDALTRKLDLAESILDLRGKL
jgi:SNF2 family DNA or RNA helicase